MKLPRWKSARCISAVPDWLYHACPDEESRRFFQALLPWCGKGQMLETPLNRGIIARLWAAGDSAFLWLVNLGHGRQRVIVRFNPEKIRITKARALRGTDAAVNGNTLTALCEGRDAAVFEL